MKETKTIEFVQLLNSIDVIENFLLNQEENSIKEDFEKVKQYLFKKISALNEINLLNKVNL